MAKRSETFFGKAVTTLPGSDALPGWGIIGGVYWLWFFMHPPYMVVDLSFIQLNIQENAEAIAALATGVTYYLGNLYDDLIWQRLKPAWAAKYTKRDSGAAFNIYDVLGISEGSYRVATKLLAAAGRDFVPKSFNELAKACRSLAVMALFYVAVPTFGLVSDLFSVWWRFVALLLAAGLGLALYPYLKGQQILKYYERTRDLIDEQNKIRTALNKLNPPFDEKNIEQHIRDLKAERILDDKDLAGDNFKAKSAAEKGATLLELVRQQLKYQRETTGDHQLFFWNGELVTSATRETNQIVNCED